MIHNSPFQIKSSGTTGEPQLHTFDKNQLIQSAQASIVALGIDSQIRALLCLPLSSVGGLMLMARSLVGDFELLIQLPKSRPLKYQQEKIDFIAMVPTQLQQSLKFDINQLRNCSKILVGGGQLSPEIIAACQQKFIEVQTPKEICKLIKQNSMYDGAYLYTLNSYRNLYLI